MRPSRLSFVKDPADTGSVVPHSHGAHRSGSGLLLRPLGGLGVDRRRRIRGRPPSLGDRATNRRGTASFPRGGDDGQTAPSPRTGLPPLLRTVGSRHGPRPLAVPGLVCPTLHAATREAPVTPRVIRQIRWFGPAASMHGYARGESGGTRAWQGARGRRPGLGNRPTPVNGCPQRMG
jgi:hypothetical protein